MADSVNLKESRRIGVLLKLANAAWRDFDRRRSFEWKVNFALWPSIGAIAGFTFTHAASVSTPAAVVGMFLLTLLGCIYINVWTPGIQARNRLDQEAAHHYWAEIDAALNVAKPRVRARFDKETKDESSAPSHDFNWSHNSQVYFTIILIVLAFAGLAHAAGWLNSIGV